MSTHVNKLMSLTRMMGGLASEYTCKQTLVTHSDDGRPGK